MEVAMLLVLVVGLIGGQRRILVRSLGCCCWVDLEGIG